MIEAKDKTKLVVTLALVLVIVVVGIIIIRKSNHPSESVIQPGTANGAVALAVDASKGLGEMPYLYRSGIWLQDAGNHDYILAKFFQENSVGKVQMEIGNELGDSKSFDDFKQAMNAKYSARTNFGDIVMKSKEAGQTLIIGQWPAKMPTWLSARSGDNRPYSGNTWPAISQESPPKCYDYKCTSMAQVTCYTDECKKITKEQIAKDGYVVGWAGVVDYTVRYFRNDLGVSNLGYYVGHEQNKDWIGSEEEFYQTYAATARAVKAVEKNILIGGAGPWDDSAPRIKCGPPNYNEVGTTLCKGISGWTIGNNVPMNKNFIEYAKNHNLPIDFINWHSFGQFPAKFMTMAENARGWLKDNGFPENTPLFPADWTVWANTYPADYIDTEYSPAYITSALFNMDKAKIQWQGHDFNVGASRDAEKGVIKIVDQRGKDAQFIGTWAIFTPDKIIKPSYNSFKLTSLLYGKQESQTANRFDANIKDEFVTTIASQTQDKSKTRVLISNFIPQGDMLVGHLTDKFQNSPSMLSTKDYKNQIKGCVQKEGATKDQIVSCAKNILDTISDPTIKARLQTQVDLIQCFKSAQNKLQCVQDVYAKTTDQQTKIDIDAIRAEYQKITDSQKNPRQVNLNLSNLPFSGQATLTTYVIDKDHSNSCRYNKKTEPTATDTECGINGAVDKAVAQAKKEAREKALPAALEYLKQHGYSDQQLNSLKDQAILPCLTEEKMLACVQQELTATCQKDTALNCEKVTQDLKDAYAKYQEVFDGLFYYGKYNELSTSTWIDKINNDPNISLEGSKQTQPVAIVNGKYQGTLTLQPDSVVLVEVGK